jgi:uncharacterized protein YjdB
MNNPILRLASAVLALAMALVPAACGGSGGGPEVTGVDISPTDLSLYVGDQGALTATVRPMSAPDRTIAWESSDDAVAAVSGSGETIAVEARAAGHATITATAAHGRSAVCLVTVGSRAVSGVSLDRAAMPLVVGGVENLTATIAPANAIDKAVTWTSSAPSVARVEASGLVAAISGLAPGSATITVATAEGSKTAACQVQVSQPGIAVTGVSLDRAAMAMGAGSIGALAATIFPLDATNRDVTWVSSNPAAAAVSGSGLGATVSAVAPGSADITVTTADGGRTATCAVQVGAVHVPVASVLLDSAALSVDAGGSATLTATVLPGNATNRDVTWTSSNPAAAAVFGSGLAATVNGMAEGAASITVATADGGITATCAVRVSVRVVGVSLFPESLTVALGRQVSLAAVIAPAGATNKNATWASSDPQVVKVGGAGLVGTAVALREGEATVTVTTEEGSYTAACVISVVPPPLPDPVAYASTRFGLYENGRLNPSIGNQWVNGVAVDGQGNVHAVGQAGGMAAYWLNGASVPLPTTLSYSGCCSVAVSGDGHVYIAGFERTATTNQYIARLWVDGAQAPLQGVSDAGTPRSRANAVCVRNGDIYVGGGIATTETGTTYQPVVWKNGVRHNISGGASGYFILDLGAKADGGMAALCTNYVTDVYNQGYGTAKYLYIIDAAMASMATATIAQSATMYGMRLFVDGNDIYVGTEAGNGVNSAIYWKVTGNTSARIPLTLPAGTSWGGASAFCVLDGSVYVAGYRAAGSVRYATLFRDNVFIGETQLPAAATDYTSYPTALSVGYPAVVPVAGVTMSSARLDMPSGYTGTLTAAVSPADATNQTLAWLSSDPAVASIAGTGNTRTINGLAPGTATIAAVSPEGPLATCTVNVLYVPVDGVSLSAGTIEMGVDRARYLEATITPDTATNKNVAWASSNPGVATVTPNGLIGTVRSVAPGSAAITVTTEDGQRTATCQVTVALDAPDADVYIAGPFGLYINGQRDAVIGDHELVDVFVDGQGNVHAAGHSNDPVGQVARPAAYFLNGAKTVLEMNHGEYDTGTEPTSMFVTGDGAVYVTGIERFDDGSTLWGSRLARLWKDGAQVPLPDVDETGGDFSYAYRVIVRDGDVWVVGNDDVNRWRPVIWKNDQIYRLGDVAITYYGKDFCIDANGVLTLLLAQTQDEEYNPRTPVRVQPGDLQAGALTPFAPFWNDLEKGPNGEHPWPLRAYAHGADTYLVGFTSNTGFTGNIPCYWKGLARYGVPMPEGCINGDVDTICILDGYLYLAGVVGHSVGGVEYLNIAQWMDGVLITDGRAVTDTFDYLPLPGVKAMFVKQ